jgi:hypothetical protein
MGRPTNRKFFGDPASAGYQIAVSAWFTGGVGPVAAWIESQRSNKVYVVTNGVLTQSLRLVQGAPLAAGQMQVVVQPQGTTPFLTAAQTQAVYDGTPPNGSFVGGADYVGGEVITLSNGATITVATVDAGDNDAVLTFAVTTVGSSVSAGTVLTQTSSTLAGTGFTLTPGVDNINNVAAPAQSARIINNRVVKTFEGNIYNWPVTAEGDDGRPVAEIGS